MKNKEFYREEIFNIACQGRGIAISKDTNKPIVCRSYTCPDCLLYDSSSSCSEGVKSWCDKEHIEKPCITKEERAFLDMLKDDVEYITPGALDGGIYLYTKFKRSRYVSTDILKNVSFNFMKGKDQWSIETLKKLEVIE